MGELYLALGGGAVADILLWKKRHQSVLVLVSSMLMWIIFEKAGYNFMQVISNLILLLVVILFFWAKSAALFNRAPPPLPDLEVSEEVVVKGADETLLCIVSCARHCNWWRLETILAGVLLCFSVPVLYDKNQALIDEWVNAAYRNIASKIAST